MRFQELRVIRRWGLRQICWLEPGASVFFSEVTEVRDAVHLLTPRAVNEDVARALVARDEVV